MRKFLLLCFLICLINPLTTNAQQPGTYVTPGKVSIRCGLTISKVEPPLIIIDGIPLAEGQSGKLDPNDIESITILKNAEATALYGTRGVNGVILVTTKHPSPKQFQVRDINDGQPVAGATLKFISGKDTLMFLANDSGIARNVSLKRKTNYQLEVSSVGYQPYASQSEYNTSADQEILLERDTRTCDPVIVSAGATRRCRCIIRCANYVSKCAWIYENFTSRDSTSFLKLTYPVKAFPNPVRRGQQVTVVTSLDKGMSLTLKLISVSGQLQYFSGVRATEGTNRLEIPTDSRWAAGIYILQLIGEKGKLLQQERIIVH